MADRAPPCPICRRPLPTGAADPPPHPFCSQRCRTIDLGGWLTGAYRVSRPIEEEDLDEGFSRRGLVADADEDGGGTRRH